MPRESTGMTLFQLVYGGEVVMPVEIRMKFMRVKTYDEEGNMQKRRVKLDLVTETQKEVAARLWAYKRCMCQAYNKKVSPHSL